ncbi:MAG: hypothetical protein Q8M03_16400 [Legionella sp.]|nr:hypothetical protein [Legionella sp.]
MSKKKKTRKKPNFKKQIDGGLDWISFNKMCKNEKYFTRKIVRRTSIRGHIKQNFRDCSFEPALWLFVKNNNKKKNNSKPQNLNRERHTKQKTHNRKKRCF